MSDPWLCACSGQEAYSPESTAQKVRRCEAHVRCGVFPGPPCKSKARGGERNLSEPATRFRLQSGRGHGCGLLHFSFLPCRPPLPRWTRAAADVWRVATARGDTGPGPHRPPLCLHLAPRGCPVPDPLHVEALPPRLCCPLSGLTGLQCGVEGTGKEQANKHEPSRAGVGLPCTQHGLAGACHGRSGLLLPVQTALPVPAASHLHASPQAPV